MIYLSSVCCEGDACSGKCSRLLSLRQNIRQQQIKWNLTVIIKLTAESSRKKLVSVSLVSRSVGSCGKIEVLAPSSIINFAKLSRDFYFKLVSLGLYETWACPRFSPPCVGVFDQVATQQDVSWNPWIYVFLVLLIIFLAFINWKQDCAAAWRWTDRHAHNVNWNQTNREETPMAWEEEAEVCTSQHIHWVNCEPQDIRHLPSARDQSNNFFSFQYLWLKI